MLISNRILIEEMVASGNALLYLLIPGMHGGKETNQNGNASKEALHALTGPTTCAADPSLHRDLVLETISVRVSGNLVRESYAGSTTLMGGNARRILRNHAR